MYKLKIKATKNDFFQHDRCLYSLIAWQIPIVKACNKEGQNF